MTSQHEACSLALSAGRTRCSAPSGTTARPHLEMVLAGSVPAGSVTSPGVPGRVAVVEADHAIRERLTRLLAQAGLDCTGFSEGAAYLAEEGQGEPACVVLGFDLADGAGLDLQRTLAAQRRTTPVIFQTSDGPLDAAIQAMKSGALDILQWPFEDHVAVAAVERGLDRSRTLLQGARRLQVLSERHACLTAREKQVFRMVAAGLLNKQIAYALALSEITVKAHRGRMMRKMRATSIADLVIMADRLGLDLTHPLPQKA